MKMKIITFITLLTVVFSTVNIAYRTLPAVKATYVEGIIAQDTIWTLVDSPFVVSNDVIVTSDATLTIEPGVEVRFGGNFSLIVNGAIVAKGTNNRMIHFTTNDPEKHAFWRTILLNASRSSSLIYCIVEYGTNGTTIDNGSLKMQYNVIDSNLENGIAINNGDLIAENNEIANNTLGGVRIAGGSVDISDNAIESNGDGIILLGDLLARINVERNKISLSSQSGILFGADSYGNTVVFNNTLSRNNYGLRVSTNITTYISRNYITNNTIGIYYENGNNHEAHFNDIYYNELGMDVSSTATVNATRNYWGSETGPLHKTLNPDATGNPVGGNGVNLDFIFFLTRPFTFEINNTRPTTVLWTDVTLAAVGQSITFVGTDSYDDGRVDEYFFDFADGTTSGWTTLTLFNHSYSLTGTYGASLKVRDDFGIESENAFVTIDVTDLTPLETSITLSNYTVAAGSEIGVNVFVPQAIGWIANVNLFSVKGGNFSSSSGLTDLSGTFVTTFTAPNVTQVRDIRIIGSVSMNGFANGSSHEYLKVLPPLNVQVSSDPSTIHSSETSTITVHVSDSFNKPVTDVNLTLSSSDGNLSENTGTTDLDGTAVFTFSAPRTLIEVDVTIAVFAFKQEYAEAQGRADIIVEPKMLLLTAIADPLEVISGATSTIVAQVTYDSIPVLNATVTASSDAGGDFTPTITNTDFQGLSTLVFSAPLTTMSSGINAKITIRAVLDGYVEDEYNLTMAIKPRILSVEIAAEPNITFSEGRLDVTVHVGYGTDSIAGANVTIRGESGSFSATTGSTDNYGNATFTFTAPQVNEQSNITVTALASADGYVESETTLQVTINPRTFRVQTITPIIRPGETGTLMIRVTCREDASAAGGATVALLYENGNSVTNTTDSTGTCTFVVTAPHQTVQMLNITVRLTNNGYTENQTKIEVPIVQPEGGLPLTTVLLIALPIVVAVVVAVLIKLKLIIISTEDSEEET
jgi:hypothetical protein